MHQSATNREPGKRPGFLFGRLPRMSMFRLTTLAGAPLAGAALAASALMVAALWGATSAQAQGTSPPAPAIKLYIFDLGSLHSANPEPLLQRGVKTTDMSVVAYLVVHPRGTLLWDSGTIA